MTDAPEIPAGEEFLRIIKEQEDQCELWSRKRIAEAGEKAPACYKALGTSLALLDCLASCWWGCAQGDHVAEYLVGRCVSSARAALRLGFLGFYDESLTLVRSVGETSNLLNLFALNSNTFADWKTLDELKRRRAYSAVKVRYALGETPIRIDENRYAELSGRSVHVTPLTAPQKHNPMGLPITGGFPQEPGLLLVLNETALAVALASHGAARLVEVDNEVRKRILLDAARLARTIGGVTIDTYAEGLAHLSASPN